jgi:ankyrin repeat protein
VNTKQTIYGLTPLIKSVIYSSETANLQPVNLLLSSGADVDIQDVNGWTSLHKACEKGNV